VGEPPLTERDGFVKGQDGKRGGEGTHRPEKLGLLDLSEGLADGIADFDARALHLVGRLLELGVVLEERRDPRPLIELLGLAQRLGVLELADVALELLDVRLELAVLLDLKLERLDEDPEGVPGRFLPATTAAFVAAVGSERGPGEREGSAGRGGGGRQAEVDEGGGRGGG